MLTNPILKQWSIAVFAAKSFDDPTLLDDVFGVKIASIRHIYTNGVNRLIFDFARENGIPCTIHPLQGSNLLTSTHAILAEVDAAYIIADDESKSAATIKDLCRQQAILFKEFHFDPATHWRSKVGKVEEILSGISKEEIAASGTLKAIQKVVES